MQPRLPAAGRGEQDEQEDHRLHAERGDAQRAVPVADIVVIAQEAPRRGAGQDVSAHRGPGHGGGGGPCQPMRPGDQHPGDQDGRCDDPEVPEADQRGRAQRAGQVHHVDHRQPGQCQRAHRTRPQRRPDPAATGRNDQTSVSSWSRAVPRARCPGGWYCRFQVLIRLVGQKARRDGVAGVRLASHPACGGRRGRGRDRDRDRRGRRSRSPLSDFSLSRLARRSSAVRLLTRVVDGGRSSWTADDQKCASIAGAAAPKGRWRWVGQLSGS